MRQEAEERRELERQQKQIEKEESKFHDQIQLLSQQMFYVTDEYNAMLGYGGLAYTKYNYTDAEWTAYVAEQGGELKY